MKKVLFITTIGGFLQQFELNDVKILKEMKCEIHYASNFSNLVYDVQPSELERMGIKIHHINIQKSPLHIIKNWKAYLKIRKIVREQGIDIIHCHNPVGGIIGRACAIFNKKVSVVYTAHGFHFYKGAPLLNWVLYYTAEYLFARKTDVLITINQEDYERGRRFKLRNRNNIYKIPGVGVLTNRFNNIGMDREKIREELGIARDAFFVLSVGELNTNKNHATVIRAIAEKHDDRVVYGICGKGYMEQELTNLALSLGISDKVFLYGFRTDIPKMLVAADCFVFPSIREGLGVAAIEAMAAGLPLVTSDCRGTREYMEDGKNGIVCRKGTSEEYKKAISLLMENRKLCTEMGAYSREVAKRFDVAVTDKMMRKIYQEMVH